MTAVSIPRLMVAATGSGTGKTTLVCGLLSALSSIGHNMASFKCGPDYIDPMFHTEILGTPCRNLDLFFTGEEKTRQLFIRNAKDHELSIMEGVMGFYDGLAMDSDRSSAYHLAKLTKTPVVLLVNGKGMALSVAALIQGFAQFRQDSGVAGVILNRISPMSYPALKQTVEQETGIPVLGYLPQMDGCNLESRHLGLITAAEVTNLKEKIERIAEQMKQSLDLDGLVRLAQSAPPLQEDFSQLTIRPSNEALPMRIGIGPKAARNPSDKASASVRIGIARDHAFCFYYRDSLELLEELGGELVPFSPLNDHQLPSGLSGLILGGGYPELYTKALEENQSMRDDIRTALLKGLPCIAECGGFLYLHEKLEDETGEVYRMAGVVPGTAFPTGKLTRFGYVTLTAKEDNLLCRAGEQIRGHEFHYWDSRSCGEGFHAEKPSGKKSWDCVHTSPTLYAGFPHLYLWSNPAFAQNFLAACANRL